MMHLWRHLIVSHGYPVYGDAGNGKMAYGTENLNNTLTFSPLSNPNTCDGKSYGIFNRSEVPASWNCTDPDPYTYNPNYKENATAWTWEVKHECYNAFCR